MITTIISHKTATRRNLIKRNSLSQNKCQQRLLTVNKAKCIKQSQPENGQQRPKLFNQHHITATSGGLKETYLFLQGLQVERLERISVDYLLIGTVFLLNAQSFSLLLLFSSSFWYLFNFCRHSHGNLLKWHASFSGDYDQGELHYSAGPHRRLCQPKLTHTKTCLLYTSPSPRDRHRSRMPSSA